MNNLAFAKHLRQSMTDAEHLLWRHLRGHHLGAKFKRQQPIGRYVVDFVCFESKLIVEVDGGQHLENVSDEHRDAWLRDQEFKVLRFWNNQVLKETEAVLEKIYEEVSPSSPSRRSSPSPQPLSHQGRGAKQNVRVYGGRAFEEKGTAQNSPLPSWERGGGEGDRSSPARINSKKMGLEP
ncbi:MAG: DUF559 domain-containing protein [Methylobacillus sp.]|jgi:very-short-patch-repair endonuclease|nr:DUF559 domain-containing protein [Methylobacillus sp.]